MTIDSTHYEHDHPRTAMRFVIVVSLFALLFTLAASLPGRTARQPSMPGVTEACESPACLSPRQLITAREARYIKGLAHHALLVDIRAPAEAPARLALDSDAHVPFMEPAAATAAGNGGRDAQMEFRLDFGPNVDQVLRDAHMRHDDPVILMSPVPERAVLAALLLQERGYTRILVLRD